MTTRGGDAAVSCTSGTPSVTYATPADAWRVEVEPGGAEARVDFRSAKDRVRIRVQCTGGTPEVSVEDSARED